MDFCFHTCITEFSFCFVFFFALIEKFSQGVLSVILTLHEPKSCDATPTVSGLMVHQYGASTPECRSEAGRGGLFV